METLPTQPADGRSRPRVTSNLHEIPEEAFLVRWAYVLDRTLAEGTGHQIVARGSLPTTTAAAQPLTPRPRTSTVGGTPTSVQQESTS